MLRYVPGWRDAVGFHSREVDLYFHAIHLGTPLEYLWIGSCHPEACCPMPPGSMPGDVEAVPDVPWKEK